MVVLGIDADKRTHTVVAVDELGQTVGQTTVPATSAGNLKMIRWSRQFGERRFAVEDCRHLSRRLERDLLAAGEQIVRVPPRLMGRLRRSDRQPGKSDPIDAQSVARATQREADLPTARLDGVERDLRPLVDHREDLVNERTRAENRLRWHLHELDPTLIIAKGSLDRHVVLDRLAALVATHEGTVARLATEFVGRIHDLTISIKVKGARNTTGALNWHFPATSDIIGRGPLPRLPRPLPAPRPRHLMPELRFR